MEKLKVYIRWSACLLAVFLFGSLLYESLMQQDETQTLTAGTEVAATIVIDAGRGQLMPSTIVDCTGGEPEITRLGKGKLVV